jgi:hypothetical protein
VAVASMTAFSAADEVPANITQAAAASAANAPPFAWLKPHSTLGKYMIVTPHDELFVTSCAGQRNVNGTSMSMQQPRNISGPIRRA